MCRLGANAGTGKPFRPVLPIINHKRTILTAGEDSAMIQVGALRAKPVRGPDGSVLTLADLPSPDTKRWVIRRKAIIAAAVRSGLISLDIACKRYRLHPEELLSWQHYIDRYGFSALRTTKLQGYIRPGQRRYD
jgi:hypothetical protein